MLWQRLNVKDRAGQKRFAWPAPVFVAVMGFGPPTPSRISNSPRHSSACAPTRKPS